MVDPGRRASDRGTLSLSGDRANLNDPEVPGGEAQHSTASAFPLCLPALEGDLPAGLGRELWKGSPGAGEHAQSEIWDLETKAAEGKGQCFKQKALPFPWHC